MGTKQKPGQFDCYTKALPDEPMFVLLARDPNAPELVQEWARRRDLAISRGNRPETDLAAVEEAYDCAKAMYAWRKANDGRWRKQEPAPLTREQAIERLQWLATGSRGATPDWLPDNGWDDSIREIAIAALDLIPGARPDEGSVNHAALKAMVFTDRYEDQPLAQHERDWPTIDEDMAAERGQPIEEGFFEREDRETRETLEAAEKGRPIEDPDPLATARSLVQQADYGRTSQAGAMAEWLIDPQGMAERQQQAGVPLEEDAAAGTRLGRPPLSPSSLLLPEVKP